MSLDDLADQFHLEPKKKPLQDHEVQQLVNVLYDVRKLTDQHSSVCIGDIPRYNASLAHAVYLIGKVIAKQHGRNDVY